MMVYKLAEDGVPQDPIEDGGIDPLWRVLDGEDESEITLEDDSSKRLREHADDEEDNAAKRLKTDTGYVVVSTNGETPQAPCLAPPISHSAQRILNQLAAQSKEEHGATPEMDIISDGDIFLTEGWRERWCKCSKVWLTCT